MYFVIEVVLEEQITEIRALLINLSAASNLEEWLLRLSYTISSAQNNLKTADVDETLQFILATPFIASPYKDLRLSLGVHMKSQSHCESYFDKCNV